MHAERTTETLMEGAFRRKARKQHRCVGCRRTIEVGESYIEDLNMARGAYQSGPRYCDQCGFEAGLTDKSGEATPERRRAAEDAVRRHLERRDD